MKPEPEKLLVRRPSIPTNLDAKCSIFFLQYGLYSSFMGCFMYVIFGTSKDIAVGPAAIVAFITAEHASKDPAFVVLLTFLSGIVIMLLGLLRLGKSRRAPEWREHWILIL